MGLIPSTLQAGQILLSRHQYVRSEAWCRREEDMQLQEIRLDILNSWREEMRDQFKVILSSLENLMVVAALVLFFGYQLVNEGTFPMPQESYVTEHSPVHGVDYGQSSRNWLRAYSTFCACSLIFPLGSLILSFSIRLELKKGQRQLMGDLQKKIRRALKERVGMDDGRQTSTRYSTDDAVHRCLSSLDVDTPAHRSEQSSGSGSDASLASKAPQRRPGFQSTRKLEALRREGNAEMEVPIVAQGLLDKVKYYHHFYPITQLLLWLGVLNAVMSALTLMGLIMSESYPSVPAVWRVYVGIVGAGALGCLLFLVWVITVLFKKLISPDAVRRRQDLLTGAFQVSEPVWRVPPAAPDTTNRISRRWGRQASPMVSEQDIMDLQRSSSNDAAIRRPRANSDVSRQMCSLWDGGSLPMEPAAASPSRRRSARQLQSHTLRSPPSQRRWTARYQQGSEADTAERDAFREPLITSVCAAGSPADSPRAHSPRACRQQSSQPHSPVSHRLSSLWAS